MYTIMGLFLGWFAFCILFNLALLGVAIWAVVKIVKKVCK